ncbi:hypothetical protein BJY59DRAFT_701593 [Rhodotorula toruloides]
MFSQANWQSERGGTAASTARKMHEDRRRQVRGGWESGGVLALPAADSRQPCGGR